MTEKTHFLTPPSQANGETTYTSPVPTISQSISVRVEPLAPVAVVRGGDRSVYEGSPIVLSSLSYDPDFPEVVSNLRSDVLCYE